MLDAKLTLDEADEKLADAAVLVLVLVLELESFKRRMTRSSSSKLMCGRMEAPDNAARGAAEAKVAVTAVLPLHKNPQRRRKEGREKDSSIFRTVALPAQ